MRKKKFSLSGILKVRKYNEALALQRFISETAEDRRLAAQYSNVDHDISTAYKNIDYCTQSNDANAEIRYLYDYVGSRNTEAAKILQRRQALQAHVKNARDTYEKLRIEFEAIKLLEKRHKEKEHSINKKREQKEMHERLL